MPLPGRARPHRQVSTGRSGGRPRLVLTDAPQTRGEVEARRTHHSHLREESGLGLGPLLPFDIPAALFLEAPPGLVLLPLHGRLAPPFGLAPVLFPLALPLEALLLGAPALFLPPALLLVPQPPLLLAPVLLGHPLPLPLPLRLLALPLLDGLPLSLCFASALLLEAARLFLLALPRGLALRLLLPPEVLALPPVDLAPPQLLLLPAPRLGPLLLSPALGLLLPELVRPPLLLALALEGLLALLLLLAPLVLLALILCLFLLAELPLALLNGLLALLLLLALLALDGLLALGLLLLLVLLLPLLRLLALVVLLLALVLLLLPLILLLPLRLLALGLLLLALLLGLAAPLLLVVLVRRGIRGRPGEQGEGDAEREKRSHDLEHSWASLLAPGDASLAYQDCRKIGFRDLRMQRTCLAEAPPLSEPGVLRLFGGFCGSLPGLEDADGARKAEWKRDRPKAHSVERHGAEPEGPHTPRVRPDPLGHPAEPGGGEAGAEEVKSHQQDEDEGRGDGGVAPGRSVSPGGGPPSPGAPECRYPGRRRSACRD